MKIDAQDFAGATVEEEKRRFTMRFRDAQGEAHTLSLPMAMALSIRTVFNNLAKRAHPRPGQIPTVSKNVRGHLVYDSTASPFVILQMNEDAPYSLTIERAREIARELEARAETVAARHHQAKIT